MAKSQTAELAELIARHRPTHTLDARSIALSLVRHAKALRRIAEIACERDLTAREQCADEEHTLAIQALCKRISVGVRIDGDPRGYVVKLHFGPTPGKQPGNTWGGPETGWGIG